MRLRRSARIILFDPRGDVLLIRFVAARDGVPHVVWVTPGGKIESGEEERAAAARELREELGVQVALVGLVHRESGGTYTHLGEEVANDDVFFAAVCERDAPVLAGVDADEMASMREARWWPVATLEASAEPVFPVRLASVAREVWSTLQGRE